MATRCDDVSGYSSRRYGFAESSTGRNTVVSLAAYRQGEEARLSRYYVLVLSSIIICYFTHTRIYIYYLLIFRYYKVLKVLIYRDIGEVLAIGANIIAFV